MFKKIKKFFSARLFWMDLCSLLLYLLFMVVCLVSLGIFLGYVHSTNFHGKSFSNLFTYSWITFWVFLYFILIWLAKLLVKKFGKEIKDSSSLIIKKIGFLVNMTEIVSLASACLLNDGTQTIAPLFFGAPVIAFYVDSFLFSDIKKSDE